MLTRAVGTATYPTTSDAHANLNLHYDADVLRDALVVRSLVRFWEAWGETLKLLVAVNPRCRRLRRWPEALRATVEAPDFTTLDWPTARGRLAKLGLTKYCDLNLRNLVHDVPDKPTLEVRVLPGAIHAEPIVRAAQLFAAAHRRVRAQPLHRLGAWPAGRQSAERLLWSLPLEPSDRLYWLSRAATLTA